MTKAVTRMRALVVPRRMRGKIRPGGAPTLEILNIQYFQGWRTSRPDLPPHPSRNDQRSHSRHCFCHQPARKVGYCVLILILILILMRLLISTVGALRLPTTYDNHPIPSIHVSLWRQPLHRRSNRINLINLIKTRQSKQREFCDYLFD